MNKHTPEKWQREGNFIYALRMSRRHQAEVNVFSALVQNDSRIASDEELLANARLMEAAPDMYKALKDLLSTVEAGDNDDDFVRAAQAAVAKAEPQ